MHDRGSVADQQTRARWHLRRLATPIAAKINRVSPPAELRLLRAVVHEHPVLASASVGEDEPLMPEPPARVPALPGPTPPVPLKFAWLPPAEVVVPPIPASSPEPPLAPPLTVEPP